MKEFKPSEDFVRTVMQAVRNFEREQAGHTGTFPERLFSSAAFRYAVSCSGIFLGIFLTPITCL